MHTNGLAEHQRRNGHNTEIGVCSGGGIETGLGVIERIDGAGLAFLTGSVTRRWRSKTCPLMSKPTETETHNGLVVYRLDVARRL